MPNVLDQLRTMTTVVADTGDAAEVRTYRPEDCTTNPSLVLAAMGSAETAPLIRDEIARGKAAGLDPLGAGCCLIIAGLFVAGPMWRHKLLTVPDFFGKKYGPTAELISALILVPSYFGWIAAQ